MKHFAQENNMKIRFHTILWLDYCCQPTFTESYNDVDTENYLIGYLENVFINMSPGFDSWDILNEAVSNDYNMPVEDWA